MLGGAPEQNVWANLRRTRRESVRAARLEEESSAMRVEREESESSAEFSSSVSGQRRRSSIMGSHSPQPGRRASLQRGRSRGSVDANANNALMEESLRLARQRSSSAPASEAVEFFEVGTPFVAGHAQYVSVPRTGVRWASVSWHVRFSAFLHTYKFMHP